MDKNNKMASVVCVTGTEQRVIRLDQIKTVVMTGQH